MSYWRVGVICRRSSSGSTVLSTEVRAINGTLMAAVDTLGMLGRPDRAAAPEGDAWGGGSVMNGLLRLAT
jgi:hypothetical protein